MKQLFSRLRKSRRGICFMLTILFLISTIMSGTYAWHAFANAVNDMSGTKGNYQVVLNKYEKSINGELTSVPIAGAAFYLFKIVDSTVSPETVKQIGGIYTTDSSGSISAAGLTTGSYYFLETDPTFAYTYSDMTESSRRYDFVVSTETAVGNDVKVIAYNQRRSSSLIIEKRVVNENGEALSKDQLKTEFEFHISFSDGKQYKYSVNGSDEMELGDGGAFRLRSGQTAHFASVPVGVFYHVTETPVSGYKISSSGDSGNIQIDANANKALFTNAYSEEHTGKLVITKLISGDGEPEANRGFSFTVKIGTNEEAVFPYKVYNALIVDDTPVIREGTIKNGERIELKAYEKAVFDGIPAGLSYFVDEDDYTSHGYSGIISNRQGTILGGENTVTAVNNKRETGSLTVKKTVVNNNGSELTDEQKNKSFVFTVTIDGQTMPQFSLKNGESHTFTNVPVGSYYTVVEDDYSSHGYVTDSVQSIGNIVSRGNTAVFTNRYKETPHNGSLIIKKTVANSDGSQLTDTQKRQSFKFHVQIGGKAYDIELKNGESKAFENIPAGTFYYVYEEDYYKNYGYITSSNNAGGTIDGTKTAEFVNTAAGTGKGSLAITKKVSGGAIGSKDKAFSFMVAFSDDVSYKYRINGGTEETSLDENGRLTLKDGERAVFENIPEGVAYTVSEEAVDGYLQGTIKQNGVIAKGQTATADFVNHRSNEKTKLIIKKVTTGEGADLTKKFDFTISINGQEEKFALANGEQKEFTLEKGAVYTVAEDDYFSEGYIQTGTEGGFGTADGAVIEVAKTNTYIGKVETSLHVAKKWEVQKGTELPSSIIVSVMNGNIVAASAKITAKDNWEHTFDGLNKYDDQGNLIKYTVTENKLDGYLQLITRNSEYDFSITNKKVTPITKMVPAVSKTLITSGGEPSENSTFSFVLAAVNDAPMPTDAKNGAITIYITGQGSAEFGSIAYSTAGTYTYRIYEQAAHENGYTYDDSVYTYTVSVSSENGVLKASASLVKNGAAGEYKEAQFTNKYTGGTPKTIDVSVKKVWAGDDDANRPGSVSVQLIRNGEPYGQPIELNDENRWQNSWTGLDRESKWDVKEITDLGADYSKSISSSRDGSGNLTFTATNTYTNPLSETTNLTVNKVWSGDEAYTARPMSVEIQLYKNGSKYGKPVTLNNDNGWTYTWTALEKSTSIKWTAGEVNTPTGYVSKVTENSSKGYTVTNTYSGGGNPNTKVPYTPGSNTGSAGPVTDDPTMMWLWFAVMIASAVGLRILLFGGNTGSVGHHRWKADDNKQ